MVDIYSLETLDKELVSEEINRGKGFVLGQLREQDLLLLRKLVVDQYVNVIKSVAPEAVAKFVHVPMDSYHKIYQPDMFEHASTWPKKVRVLGPSALKMIESTSFYQSLLNCFGQFQVSDEEKFGWPNMYWRLVRPGTNDIGPLHADAWFWELGHGEMPQGYHRVKLWVSLYSEKDKSGLRVIADSHKKQDWRYHSEERDGKLKPVFDEIESELDILNLPLEAGECVIFHDKLLHGGMPNFSDSTRVSMEFTLLVPNQV